MDNSIQLTVANYPIESLVLWTNLYKNERSVISSDVAGTNRVQISKLYFTAVALCSLDALKLEQVNSREIEVKKSTNYDIFSQCVKLDGNYNLRNYVPSLMEHSRLHIRQTVIAARNVQTTSELNKLISDMNLPKSITDYISFGSAEAL